MESGEFSLAVDEDKNAWGFYADEVNFVGREVQNILRSRKVFTTPFPYDIYYR